MVIRKILAAMLIAMMGSSLREAAHAQEQALKKKDLPAAVLNAFSRAYPKATVKGFSKEADRGKIVYEIESVDGTRYRDISYTPDGSVVAIEESIAFTELPEPVRKAVKKDYPKQKVISCEKIVSGTTTKFELLVQTGNKKSELVFDTDGILTEEEK